MSSALTSKLFNLSCVWHCLISMSANVLHDVVQVRIEVESRGDGRWRRLGEMGGKMFTGSSLAM